MEQYRRSWRLVKASWAVLRADRELLMFPLLSFVALVVLVITFIVWCGLILGFTDPRTGDVNVAAVVVGFVFYVVAYSVIFFFNVGLVGAAMIRLDGGNPTVGDGFRIATARLPAIIGYALIAATVGMVLRLITGRPNIIRDIVVGVLGIAWSVLTFFVVPVLVAEKLGPIAAVRRSGALVRSTWGEQLIGGGGIGFVFWWIAFGLYFLVAGLLALFSVSGALVPTAMVAAVLAGGAVSLFGAALSGIYSANLYRFATTGDPGAFDADAMTAAFEQKAGGVSGFLGRPR